MTGQPAGAVRPRPPPGQLGRRRPRRGSAAAWPGASTRTASLSGTFHLPPLAGAVLLKALRSAVALDHPAPAFDEHHPADPEHSDPADPEHSDPADPEHSDPVGSGSTPGVSAETPGSIPPLAPTSTSLADALLTIAEAYLAGQAASADDPEPYQVILHVGTDALPPARSTDQPANHPVDQAADPPSTTTNVSAETPASSKAPPAQPPPQRQPGPRGPGDPADPARCHVEDGPALSLSTAQMIACSATVSWMLHDSAGKLLDLGRRRHHPNAAVRRAVRTGTNAGAGSRAVSRAGLTCTTSSTGPTAAAPAWTTWSACAATTINWCTTAVTSSLPPAMARSPSSGPTAAVVPSCPPLPASGRDHRRVPQRRHHPRDDHPGLVRRPARPRPRHLYLLQERRKRRPRRRARPPAPQRPAPRPPPHGPPRHSGRPPQSAGAGHRLPAGAAQVGHQLGGLDAQPAPPPRNQLNAPSD